MKSNRVFILGIIAFLVILFIIEYNLPKKFVWVPTFSQKDHQPFGCAVFDDILTHSLPGYTVTDLTFYQLSKEDSTQNKSYLVIAENLKLGQVDIDYMLSMAKRGNNFLLVASSFNEQLSDTLGFDCSYAYFNFNSLKKYATSQEKRDTIFWLKDPVYNEAEYYFYPQLCNMVFLRYDSLNVAMAEEKTTYYIEPRATAIKQTFGKGEIVLASTPLLFTNYGMLDGGNAAYLFRILSQLKGLPLVRTEAYMKTRMEDQQSPLRYFLSQPPLRWGLYMTIIVILLFMFFTARRRQRPIPVVKEPENKSIEFTELIGTLYFQKKDHADLIRKKYIYFAETLRRTCQIDIEDESEDSELAGRIAGKTGLPEEEIGKLLKKIRFTTSGKAEVWEKDMKDIIDEINKIINHL